MKIPKIIYNVLEQKGHFDYLFLYMLKKDGNAEDAYDSAIEEIRKYAPDYEPSYSDYNSYRARLHKKIHKINPPDKEMDVPEYIVKAVTGGFMDVFHKHYRRTYHRKKSYELAVKEINKYFPLWSPYKNYQSFVASQTYRSKIKKVTRKKKVT